MNYFTFFLKPLGLVTLSAVVVLHLPFVVLSQEEMIEMIDDNSSDFSTSTNQTNGVNDTQTDPWFSIDTLTGNVQQGDFVVGPGKIEIEIKPGETVVKEITVANRISDDRTFELVVEDVTGSNEKDQAVVLLGNETGPYTLKDYISFPKNTFNLKLGERARIPVTISIPADAEPGGRYGSVLVSTISTDGGDAGGTPRSPVIARIGTLFFVTVPGEINKSGITKEITFPNNKHIYNSGPIKFNLLYENTGSVHLNPYGELRVENLFGEEVGFVELEPWFSLPNSLRTREVVWDRELLFGRYTATAFINRGYDNIIDEISVSFWVLPWKVMGTIFLIIFIFIFSIRAFFRTFEFKRRS